MCAYSTDLSMTDLAASLLYMKQLKQPLQPKEDPKPRRESRDRNDRGDRNSRGDGRRRDARADRGDRERAPRKPKANRSDVDWQTYRLEVGKEHGAKPGDIVGAIANEISLDSSYIGQINLFERHSIVQLPKNMPSNIYKKLKGVRVRRQQIDISLSDAPVVTQKRKPRGERGDRQRRYN